MATVVRTKSKVARLGELLGGVAGGYAQQQNINEQFRQGRQGQRLDEKKFQSKREKDAYDLAYQIRTMPQGPAKDDAVLYLEAQYPNFLGRVGVDREDLRTSERELTGPEQTKLGELEIDQGTKFDDSTLVNKGFSRMGSAGKVTDEQIVSDIDKFEQKERGIEGRDRNLSDRNRQRAISAFAGPAEESVTIAFAAMRETAQEVEPTIPGPAPGAVSEFFGGEAEDIPDPDYEKVTNILDKRLPVNGEYWALKTKVAAARKATQVKNFQHAIKSTIRQFPKLFPDQSLKTHMVPYPGWKTEFRDNPAKFAKKIAEMGDGQREETDLTKVATQGLPVRPGELPTKEEVVILGKEATLKLISEGITSPTREQVLERAMRDWAAGGGKTE